ncbi:MAG: hypothetical protein TREMPRED_005122 [Tremellales sp. Tagirdzhanova-0007]|nr:MAG: hypothetical protein TREMPRED_005122 [Tremellales sp. Tagirdzhanova-0007]
MSSLSSSAFPSPEPSSAELHLLFTLSDSALPTGGFISSSGLESFAKHGFLSSPSSSTWTIDPHNSTHAITEFARAEVEHYASTTSIFVLSSFYCVEAALNHKNSKSKGQAIDELVEMDMYHESAMLSHVARRSSRAQGVALLTLFSRGLIPPPGHDDPDPELCSDEASGMKELAKHIVEGYKRLIRAGKAMGHLAICWGVITAALGLALGSSFLSWIQVPRSSSLNAFTDRSLHLSIFLHARSLLSSAVRLNIIGPYASSQLLLYPFREIIDHAVAQSRTLSKSFGRQSEQTEQEFWAWADEASSGPATTWPLGELLMGRHDLQHSRIFNS